MKKIAFLLFDEEAALLHFEFPIGMEPFTGSCSTCAETEKRFLTSLRSGDRRRFLQYCTTVPALETDADDSGPCELFPLLQFAPYRYAFCEKNRSGSLLFNAVFLAEDASEFHSLMSPTSLTYARTTERILRELLLISGGTETDIRAFTPETLLTANSLPKILRSVLTPNRGRGYCDVFTLTELLVRSLRENPLFLHTELECRFRTPDDETLRIVEFSADLYVHILTSVLTALLSVSADHRIVLEVIPFAVFIGNEPLAIDVKISTVVRDVQSFCSESGTLRTLARPGSVTDTHLTTAAVLASLAGIDTSVTTHPIAHSLDIYLTINPVSGRTIPGFKYRNPYTTFREVLDEFYGFLDLLKSNSAEPLSSAGDQEQREEHEFDARPL